MHSFLTPSDPKFAHSIPRRPLIKIYASHLNPTGFRAADAAGAFGLDLFAKKTRLPHKLPGRREKANRRATGKRKFVDRRIAPQEIAELIGVTVGSLQVTCSRLGISLRRVVFSNGMGLLRRGGPHNGTSAYAASRRGGCSVATDRRTTSTKFTVGSSGATPSDNAARRAGEN